MLGFGLAAAAATHKGPVRERNEDFHLLDLDLGLVVVSDGMGGHRDGDIASRTATHVFRARIEESAWNVDAPDAAARTVESSLTTTHSHIRTLNRGRTVRESMGTTIVGLLFLPQRSDVILFHVGDSRAYRWQSAKLSPLTRDHSAYEAWRDRQDTSPEPKRNILLQAIGVGPSIAPTVTPLVVENGDMVFLCSDGISDVLAPSAIENILAGVNAGSLQEGCDAVLQAALDAGATDNVTAALVARH
jgi:protein phosphatase